MSHVIRTGFVLLLFLFLGTSRQDYAAQSTSKEPRATFGTLQKMIVQSGTVTMRLDGDQLKGSSSHRQQATFQFGIAANSFFSVLIFNGQLRGPEPGMMALIPEAQPAPQLPDHLSASFKQLVIEKFSPNAPLDLAVRDGKTGFTFFKIEGHQFNYEHNARSLSITGGRLVVSKELAESLGRPSDAGVVAGEISIGAAMEPIEVDRVDENGDVRSAVFPALRQPQVGTVPGPDIIVGDLIGLDQLDNGAVNGRVGLALGTDACNKGTENVDWIALPSNDHPFIPQNLYRMSGGADNTERFEQIGQSWGKHAFAAASSNTCGFGCNGVGGDHLGSGCSDAYGSGLNGSQGGIGSRAWVNPFTGSFPGSTANNHSGHIHDVTSHRILVDVNDLNTSLNTGATYFAEAEYIVPHEYTWCQSHPGQCNMYNNASYRRYNVTGVNQPFTFNSVGATVREEAAIFAWTGATVIRNEPDPGNDGIWYMGFKVTNPSTGVWHYEYALYNQNLDRAIQSFSVPLGAGVNVSNIGFHAPIQHPGWANDGTQGNAGYSSTPWNVTQDGSSITWSTETFAQNQNANAIRFATLYNFRFDADQPPNPTDGTVGFFKTGGPMPVLIDAPGNVPTPSPTPTPTASPTPTPTPTPIPTPSPCAGLTIIQIGGSIVPGSTDSGNHTDDGTTFISLPFSYTLYDQSFTGVNVSSNGNAQFITTDTAFSNVCLPWSDHNYTIYPYWDDLRTDSNTGCAGYPGGTCGVYTSISGNAPNRIFNIEWRAVYFASPGSMANFEIRLYEGQNRFDVIYGTVDQGNSSSTAGVQRDDTCSTQYFCNGSGGAASGGWTLSPVGTPSPTPTATVTPTATATATATIPPSPSPTPSEPPMTATPTPTATTTATAIASPSPTGSIPETPTATPTATATPTPRSSPSPRARPTPPPRP
jgi:hypothetical protein